MTDRLTELTTGRMTRFLNTDGIRSYATDTTALRALNLRLANVDHRFRGVWTILPRADGRVVCLLLTSDSDDLMIAMHGMGFPVYLV